MSIPTVVLPDSGPPTPTRAMPACFQTIMRQLWSLDKTVLADCGSDCPKNNDYLVDLTLHYARGANHSTGILNAYDDAVDIQWWNMGGATCSPAAPAISQADWEAALTQLRQAGKAATNRFDTYYVPSTVHGWLNGNFYSTTVNGTKLTDWTRDLINGSFHDVGP
ncbi:MAG TPA: hypothetical protein VNO21_14295 [Polyangiaceae bacterium]|nr:hypothetical protein [Polyangiaceae bacterium]